MLIQRRLEAFLRRVIPLLSRVATARFTARSKQVDRLLMFLATTMFVGGFVAAYINLPGPRPQPVWILLIVTAVIGVPLTLTTNTAEYLVSLKLLGYRVPLAVALQVSLVAAAANLLPLPGSVFVRTHAIRRLGAKTGRALGVSTLVGLAWVAITAALAGGFLLAHGRMTMGATTASVGALLLGATLYLSSRFNESRSIAFTGQLFLVETASVLVKAARLYVVFQALHYQVDVDQVMALTMAAVVATASGFFPGGMGATEVFSAAISPLIDLPAAVGLLVAAIDRLLGIAVLGLLSGVLLLRTRDMAEKVKDTTKAPEAIESSRSSWT